VTFTCADSLSGVAACTAPAPLGEGLDQHVTGSAIDVAGNSDSVTVAHINVDETAPVITGAATTTPNANGWYASDVVVHWTCSDALSGIPTGACPANSVITARATTCPHPPPWPTLPGTRQRDRVGHPHRPARTEHDVGRSRPGLPAQLVQLAGRRDAQRRDNLSGVTKTYFAIDGGTPAIYAGPVTMPRGIHTITYWSKDNAGNVEDRSATGNTLTIRSTTSPHDQRRDGPAGQPQRLVQRAGHGALHLR